MPKLKLPKSLLGLALVALSGMIFAQTTQPDSNQSTTAPAQDISSQSGPRTPALQPRFPRYRVAPSDVLAISFPLSSELNQTVTVQPDGFISVNNIGSLYVQGDTVPQIVDALKVAAAKILHDPIIAVDLTNFQHPQFTVNGQVGKPGQYELRSDTTVSEGIAVAGGFLPSAKYQAFLLHRVSPDWVEVKKLNVGKVLHGKRVNEDVHLQPGDMIYVPETIIARFRQYVPYAAGIAFNPSSLLF
jgi:polysaccharide export outer membrane protein